MHAMSSVVVTCRRSWVSAIYERGYRQLFAVAGFPGIDAEAAAAIKYFATQHGSVVVNLSCGSGLLARKSVQSGNFAGVVASGFSESMLDQAAQYLSTDYKAQAACCCCLQTLRACHVPWALWQPSLQACSCFRFRVCMTKPCCSLQRLSFQLACATASSQQQAFTTCCSRLHATHHLQLSDRTVITSDSKRCGGNASSSCARCNHQNLHAALG